MKKISALLLCAALLPACHNGYDKKDGKVYFHTAWMSDHYYKVELQGADAKTFEAVFEPMLEYAKDKNRYYREGRAISEEEAAAQEKDWRERNKKRRLIDYFQ